MIQYLRRMTVRQRIFGGFFTLALLVILAIGSNLVTQRLLLQRLDQVTRVTGQADQLLLLASVRVHSSHLNLMRYIGDYAPTANDALQDIEEATQNLQKAQALLTNPKHQQDVAQILDTMTEYKLLLVDIRAAYAGGQETSPLFTRALQLGNEMGEEITQVVRDSEAQVAAENEAAYSRVRLQRNALIAGYAAVLVLAALAVWLLERSINRPVAQLRQGAEAFLQGRLDATVPAEGKDELSLLAQTFNQMLSSLQASQIKQQEWTAELEERVNHRTAELAQALEQLQQEAETRDRLIRTIREISAPVIPIMQDIMVMPIVGTLDSERAQRVKDDLLTSVERERTRVVLLDITGLAVMDTAVANALLKTAGAAKLLGAEAILVGIAPEVAETLVQLGVELRELRTAATLEQGLNLALRLRGKPGAGRREWGSAS